jgi:membrane fusion protein (multidrug efflux system)
MPDDAAHAPSPAQAATLDPFLPEDARRAPGPGRRRWLFAAGALVLLAAAAWGADWWAVGRFMQGANDAYLDADQVVVAPKVQGYVAAVLVADNQDVRAGQALVRIDPRPLQASLDQAVAAAAAREADLEAAKAQLDRQVASAAQARAELGRTRASAGLAERQLERYRPLVRSGAETAERLEQLASERDQAREAEAAGAAAADAAQRQIGVLQAQIVQAAAQVKAAQAAAEQARLNLGDTVVTSAIAGRVGDRAVRVGQFVNPGTRLMTVVPLGDIYLTANFKETQIGRMRPGQPVKVRLDALPGRDIEGVVESFAPGTGARFALLPPENATGNFTKIVQRVPVRIRLTPDAADRARLLPGLSATVKVDTRGAS